MNDERWWQILVSTPAVVTVQAVPVAPGVDPRVGQRQQLVRAVFRLYLPTEQQAHAWTMVPQTLLAQQQHTLIHAAQIFPVSRSLAPDPANICHLKLLDPDCFWELSAQPWTPAA